MANLINKEAALIFTTNPMTRFWALFPFPIISGKGTSHSRPQKSGMEMFIPIPVPKNWKWNFDSRSQNLGMGWSIPVPENPKVIPAHPCFLNQFALVYDAGAGEDELGILVVGDGSWKSACFSSGWICQVKGPLQMLQPEMVCEHWMELHFLKRRNSM